LRNEIIFLLNEIRKEHVILFGNGFGTWDLGFRIFLKMNKIDEVKFDKDVKSHLAHSIPART